ncbi:MAG: M1 family metallopeptidase [Bacteroidota bacterium]
MPSEIYNAYENGTRSWNGSPGKNYWQNLVDYDIQVEVQPKDRTITGRETVVYYNNSPENINKLVVRLYYDVFKKGGQREMDVNPADIGSGIEIQHLKINKEKIDLHGDKANRRGTNLFIALEKPLAPGGSVNLEIEWKQLVPLTVRRTGAIDSTSFFVGYWYPQVAVYDDIFGWDELDYTFQTEMYNNLGNYTVQIKVPKNYTVWATGEFTNPKEVLTEKILEKYSKALSSDEVVHIIDQQDLNQGVRHTGDAWEFSAKEVPDFAFALSDHYLWDAAMEPLNEGKVLLNAAFPADDAGKYSNLIELQQKAVGLFSTDLPGISFPYPKFSIFIGLHEGGTEFPMMANNPGPDQNVTIHEMFHSYFPMYVRINERKFAWMDEGWANYITQLITDRLFLNNQNSVFTGAKVQFGETYGSLQDLPLITPSHYFDDKNYGYASYPLPQFIYSMLNDYLGDEVFFKALRTYVRRWAKKSPTPYDFFYTFEDVSGENLEWLWKPWFFRFGSSDIAIREWSEGILRIANNGNRPVPLVVAVYYKNGGVENISKSAKYFSNNEEAIISVDNHDDVRMILVNREIPDANDTDNIFPSLEKLSKGVDEGIIGKYKFKELPLTGYVTKQEGKFHLEIPGGNISFYLLPIEKNTFESLDGAAKVIFPEEKNSSAGLRISLFGYHLTSERIGN